VIFRALILTAGLLAAGVALAQTATKPSAPTGTSVIQPNSKLPPVAQLLQQGFEVRAGFMDASGNAYLVLQKATSAYLCHSGAVPACDMLN
jgi:hypothetical protein